MAPQYLDSLAASLEASLGFLQPLSAYVRAPLAEYKDLDTTRLQPPRFNFTDLEFEGCLLQGFSFSKCTIKNCKLVKCKLEDSEVMNSIVEECEFLGAVRTDSCIVKRSTIANSLLRRCRMESCRITSGPNVLDSQIIDCRLTSSEYQTYSGNAENKDWIIHIFDCDVQSTRSVNVTAHENNKISNSKDIRIVKTPLALRNFPTEIRDLIFLYWIESLLSHIEEQPQHLREAFDSLQSVPPLVIALRGDQKLYNEVLELVYKKAIIPLGNRRDQQSSNPSYTITSSMALNKIRKLSLK
jgi:hypothetical protein